MCKPIDALELSCKTQIAQTQKSVLTPRNFAQWTNIAQSLNPPPHILQISPQFFGYVAGLPYYGEKGALGFRDSN